MKPIPYGRHKVEPSDIDLLIETLKSDFLTQGPMVEKFEAQFKEYVQAKYALAVTNGTAALHLAALALGVKTGDKVLCASNTFAASANCIRYCGGEVEFLDINPKTFCVDLEALKLKIDSDIYSGLVIVDFAGYPALSAEIRSLCNSKNMWILEDSCHALGGAYDASPAAKKIGSNSFSDISIFSFHPVKHVATGEGGMITTNNKELYLKLKKLRTHGITKDPAEFKRQPDGPWYYEMQDLGFNYRISDILCALGVAQLSRINENVSRRRHIAHIYRNELKEYPIVFQEDHPGHAYHLMVAQIEKRSELFSFLKENHVYPQVHYIPVYKLPYYESRYGKQHLVNVEKYYDGALSLPMYHTLDDESLKFVISKIKNFFDQK